MVDAIGLLPEGSKFQLLAPIVRSRKGEYRKELLDMRRAGYVRARIDGKIVDLGEDITLDKQKKHTIEIIVDRLLMKTGDALARRLADSVETSLKLAGGLVGVLTENGNLSLYSEKLACIRCGVSYPEITPRVFSFNSPHGACPACDGIGYAMAGGTVPLSEGGQSPEEDFTLLEPCEICKGARLRPESLSVKVATQSISEVTHLSVRAAADFFNQLKFTERELVIAHRILKEIRERLGFLINVGLDYLTLDRAAATLSGGEGQRIRLATQIGSGLVGVLYILDEPSIGLHQRDNRRLLQTLLRLRDLGNTVVVVEHDAETMMAADHLLDMGPGAGTHGGQIIAQGTPTDVMGNLDSLTGQYLRGTQMVSLPRRQRSAKGFLSIVGATKHNLKGMTAKIPLGLLTCVTGVSGSGKSTLVLEVLFHSLTQLLGKQPSAVSNRPPTPHPSPLTPHEEGRKRTSRRVPVLDGCKALLGADALDKVIDIDQSPIGRTPRSNPATYTGLFSFIRDLYSNLPESRVRGYKPGRYSFNVKGGRCEACQGDGLIKIEMHFLPDVYVTCEVCKGQRYNRETMEIHHKGKSIADVLNMTVDDAVEFFEHIPFIKRKLDTLHDVGLHYVKLGQSATTLSGGEAQRVKLSRELSKRPTGRTMYILDEPTTGLHFADVQRLLDVLDRLVEAGNTVLVIEHNLDVIKNADWIIDLGPEGGDRGGEIVAEGPPKEIAKSKRSYTGQVLKEAGV
jgi:excinuclease ABC subunit A